MNIGEAVAAHIPLSGQIVDSKRCEQHSNKHVGPYLLLPPGESCRLIGMYTSASLMIAIAGCSSFELFLPVALPRSRMFILPGEMFTAARAAADNHSAAAWTVLDPVSLPSTTIFGNDSPPYVEIPCWLWPG